MEAIKELLKFPSPFKGSTANEEAVKTELKRRGFDDDVVNDFDARYHARSRRAWQIINYAVLPKQQPIKIWTIVEVKDKDENIVRRFSRPVLLYHVSQVRRVNQ